MKRVCIEPGCPELTSTGPRCPIHRKVKDAQRQAKRGNLYTGHDYRGRRARTIAEQPWCSYCGGTYRLTADHVVPGDPDSALVTSCLSCNVARANRARHGVGGR